MGGLVQGATSHMVLILLGSLCLTLPSALPGSSSLPPDWAEQGGESLSPHHQELL